MNIIEDTVVDRASWNLFVIENFPPIGAFLQSYEWGTFQEKLGRGIQRMAVQEDGRTVSLFTMVKHKIPIGLSYVYSPRGPVVSNSKRTEDVITAIRDWSSNNLTKSAFLRLEPPVETLEKMEGLIAPKHYLQPRFNHAVRIQDEDEMLMSFHPSTRSNIRRAPKRGVTVERKDNITESELSIFFNMINDTKKRNSGKNAYPGKMYFESLLTTVPSVGEKPDPTQLTLRTYFGYQNGEPAAMHIVLFFAKTATYLFGATMTDKLGSKISTYLHFEGMKDARKFGMEYYDIGGVDSKRWPSLSAFKRQFRGVEFEYVGNIDVPIRKSLYYIYETTRFVRLMLN
ncbi:MAG: hypothetical protein COV07_02205 [Candidatus Vogelbacteria bacterium CG10_big_fil_rev_8_21_14_0_10_45_14]|uniref:BioF2-like acetyltransferase domain-containing protein n=1 Tax=Candidatus Vogelbacteria bacterium CG10_big_fil_rev_8_21_14_0_10_45_14 TaxID=1975042 RepID=A0A2H0RLG6_9BACT|nr:MAG: hypothetical protein COV07_02205 [Candidatus Vogelbacteria bacterium CG10_big_fil_rev_8_21_14_0_10_45_14]